MFCVVFVQPKNFIKAVPASWNSVTDELIYLAWPEHKEKLPVELNHLIKNQLPPRSNWPKFNCKILLSGIGKFYVSIVDFLKYIDFHNCVCSASFNVANSSSKVFFLQMWNQKRNSWFSPLIEFHWNDFLWTILYATLDGTRWNKLLF